MGGSSVLNYMLYVRGNKKDYDTWEADGNPGWGYKEVLHYFKKSEDNRNPYLANTYYHSAGGFLTVQVKSSLKCAFYGTFQILKSSYPKPSDLNSLRV